MNFSFLTFAAVGAIILVKGDIYMHNKLTESDIKEMKEELHYRVCELRGELLKEVKRTREYGDLSENAEYKCAKQEQNKNERRIRYLTKMIDTAEVIEDYTVGDGAGIFSRVTLYFEDDDEEQTVLLVSTVNIDIDNDMISVESPVGKAIMGHKEGDRVTVFLKNGGSYDVILRKVEQTDHGNPIV